MWRPAMASLLRRPELLAVFAIGVILGALFCMPLVKIELPHGAAELMGAAMGALIAIGGSFWLVDQQERKDQRRLRAFICLCGMDAVDSLIGVCWAGTRLPTDVMSSGVSAVDELTVARERFGLIENRLYTLDPIVVRWYVVFTRRANAAVLRMQRLQAMTLPADAQAIVNLARGTKMDVLGLNDMLQKIADAAETRANVQQRVDQHVEVSKAYNALAT